MKNYGQSFSWWPNSFIFDSVFAAKVENISIGSQQHTKARENCLKITFRCLHTIKPFHFQFSSFLLFGIIRISFCCVKVQKNFWSKRIFKINLALLLTNSALLIIIFLGALNRFLSYKGFVVFSKCSYAFYICQVYVLIFSTLNTYSTQNMGLSSAVCALSLLSLKIIWLVISIYFIFISA